MKSKQVTELTQLCYAYLCVKDELVKRKEMEETTTMPVSEMNKKAIKQMSTMKNDEVVRLWGSCIKRIAMSSTAIVLSDD